MNAPTRLVAFFAALGLAFGGAVLAGAAIDPTGEAATSSASGHGGGHGTASEASGDDAHAGADAHGEGGGAAEPSGLAVTDGGYSFETDRNFFIAGRTAPFTFRITDERGQVVRDEFELEEEKELHLIVVRRDTAIFEHLHPRRGKDGTWSVDMSLREPGVYRAYADFKVDGEQRTLATDLFVPGDFRPKRLPPARSVDQAVDAAGRPAGNLDVTLDAPGVRAGRETPLAFAVSRDGRPFERLEPYLGANGHLVALREGDLGYLHVHPTESGSGHAHDHGSKPTEAHANEVPFAATFPTAGRYRLFLQFKTGGEVRTVAYTLEVPR